MDWDDRILNEELEDAQIHALPPHALQQRIRSLINKLKLLINSNSDINTDDLLMDAVRNSTAYSLDPVVEADSIDTRTKLYSYPLISSQAQARAFLGHFFHTYINTVHQELRLIAFRLVSIISSEEEASIFEQELSVRISALHRTLRDATTTYSKLLPLVYSPSLANQSHRFTDPLVFDPQIPLSSTQLGSQQDTESSTFYHHDHADTVPLSLSDYALPLAALTRAPDLYDELEPRLGSLDRSRTGEIIRRGMVSLERYLATTHSQFHCDYPYLYTASAQLQNSLVALGDSYSVLLDPLREATEFVSRSTKLVTSSVDKLIRFFAVSQRKPCDANCGLESISHSAVIKDIGTGSTSPISIIDSMGYERVAKCNPRYHNPADIQQGGTSSDLRLRYRNTYTVAGRALDKLTAAEHDANDSAHAKLTTLLTAPFNDATVITDADKQKQTQCNRISASPLLIVEYVYKFIAGSTNSSLKPANCTSATSTSNDIFRILTAATDMRHTNNSNRDTTSSSVGPPTAKTKLSSCLPGHGMPIFTHSLDVDAADARVKAGPAVLPVNTHLFNSKSLVIDEALVYDLNLAKTAFIDIEDYYRMKLDNFDSLTGDIIATVNRHISARVKAHIAYANAGLPANLLHLHYYMIYGKLVHLRARLLYHYNHLEYVRCKMDSDLHLHTLDFPFERSDNPFRIEDIGDTLQEIMSKETPAGSGTVGYGVLGFKRDDSLTERSSLKANDILAPDKSRIIFSEAIHQLSNVIERDILYAGSTLVEYLSSDAAENKGDSSELEHGPLRVDRMVILLFLYEQELNLVERKRQVVDQALKCYFHSVNYADSVKWLQYVSGIIDMRPSYDAHLLAATNDINSFTGCQALVLRLQQVSRFIEEYITAVLEDDCREAASTRVHSHIERKLVSMSLPPAQQKPVSDAASWKGSASQRHSSTGSRRGSSAFQRVGSKLAISQSGYRPLSALASQTSKYMGDDHRDSSLISERSSVDGFSQKEGPKRALLLSKHGDMSDDHFSKRVESGRTASVVTKDSYVITFPRYSGFGSPVHPAFAQTTICDIHYSIGKLINLLSDLDKYAYIFTSKYIFSPRLPAYANDLCHCAVYEAAREELFFVSQSRRTRGALGTLPQYLHKQCRYGLYGFPYELVQSVKTIPQANECLNILASKRNLALLTIQTTIAVQCLGSCYNELGRRLSKLSIGRGPWTNSCLEDMLPNFVNFEEFLTNDKHEVPRAKPSGARHVPEICKETETEYDYSICLLDFSNRDFTSTFDSFQLPNDFDFEFCLFDPLAGAAIRLLREMTPTIFKIDPLFLDKHMDDLLEAALPDVILSDDSSEEEFILATNSKSAVKNTTNLTEKHLTAASLHAPHGPGSAVDLSYKSYHPYAHIPNFLSPSTVSDIAGTLSGFSYCSTLFSITTEQRRDGFLEASHSQLAQISKKYQHELSSIIDLLINRGPEKMGPKTMSSQDNFETNPYIYLDNVVGFMQRLVFVQACGLEFYRTVLNELIETVMIPLRNLNTACELKTRHALMAQEVDISAVSAVVLLDNVPESTSFFITQQYADLQSNDIVSKGAIPLGKEPQESALNKYTANDCFLSFLILAAEYKYIWSNAVYIRARSTYAELQDKLASGVVGSLLMFERARCIESVLLTHKDRLLALKRVHLQTDHERDSLTTSDTTRSARSRSSSHVSTGVLEGVSDLPFYLRFDLRNMELVTTMLMLCDHTRAHSLRGQLADILNRLHEKHKQMYLCEAENILIRQEPTDQSDWGAYISKVADYSSASPEQQSLEFLSEFKIIDGFQNLEVDLAQSLRKYLPSMISESKENGKRKTKQGTYKALARQHGCDVTDIYDILCISPYLLDHLVHENISSLLFGHKPDTLTKVSASQNVLPNLIIVPPGSSIRFVMASKTTSLFQAVPLLTGLIHLYSSYLHYFDFSLVLQKLSCRLAMSGHEHHDEQDFDAEVHDLLLDDSSSGFIRRANGYSDFILKMALGSQAGEEPQYGDDHMQGCITRIQGDKDDSINSSSSASELPTPPSSRPENHVRENTEHPGSVEQGATLNNAALGEILPNGNFELDDHGEKIDSVSIQQETKHLIGQLRLVSNSKALDFKIKGYRCKNNMLVFFARLMSLVMISVWKQCKPAHQARYAPRGNPTATGKEARKAMSVVDFNKYAASLGILDGTEQDAKHRYQLEDEYAASDPRILEYMSSKKVLELQAMPITPLEESSRDSDVELSSATDNNEDPDLFLPEVGEAVLLTSYTFVEVLKIVYTMRDFAFERIMGYALVCLKAASSHGDVISTDSLFETFENVKRITGFDLVVSNPTNKIIDIILGRLKPSNESNGLPGILEENVINERTIALLAHRGNEYSASGMEVTEESKQMKQRESSDVLLKNWQPSDVCGDDDDTLRATKRVSLDLLEHSLPESRPDYPHHDNQSDLLQSVTGAGLKLDLKTLKTCGEHTDLFRPKILNNRSAFSPKLVFNRFAELTHLSIMTLPFLDGLFNGLCSGARFGSSLSCFGGYAPIATCLDQNEQSMQPFINLNCSPTNLGHHLVHMGLNSITHNQPLIRDTVSHRASLSFRSTSARSSTTLNEPSFAEIFGGIGHQSVPLDQLILDGSDTRVDASVMHMHIFLQQLKERNHLHTYGKREAQPQNRHIVYNFSDFFLLSERISPIVLYSGEKVLGIDTIDEYSEFCALSECGRSIVTKNYIDIFDPVYRALAHERAGSTEPPRTKCVVVGKLKLFQLYNMLNCLPARSYSGPTRSILGDSCTNNSNIHQHSSLITFSKQYSREREWLAYLPGYVDTVLPYHINPSVEPWLNSARLSMNIFLLTGYVYNQLLEALVIRLEDLVEKIKLYVPINPNDNFMMVNRFFKNSAPIYPLVPGLYGLSPADVTIPYLPGDSLQSTRFLHRYFGRNFITIEALSNGVASSGENQNLVVLTNYALAQMLDKFKSILFSEMTQRIRLKLQGSLLPFLGMRANLFSMTISNTEMSQTLTKMLTSMSAAVSSYSAARLHTLQSRLSSLRMLNTSLVREGSLLPVTIRNIITHIYSDALNMLFYRVTAEKEIAADINDDACSIARKTVASERIKALVRLSQCVSSHSKFFLECAEKEKEIAFYEEALALETRFMRKSAAFNDVRRGSLERKISSYSTLFEQEYIRLVGLNNMLVDAGKELEASLRLELAQLSQQLSRLNEDNECLRIELQDRMSIVSKAKAKKDADNIFAGINTLTPIATIAEAMALPDNIKVDVERLQINTQKVRQEVEILKAEIHNLKKQYTMDVALSEDRAKQLRNNQNLLQMRRRKIIDTANTLLRDSERTMIDVDAVWVEAREAQKAEHWHLVDRLRALRIEARTLENTYRKMQQEVQRVRREGEKLILGGLTPLTFKSN